MDETCRSEPIVIDRVSEPDEDLLGLLLAGDPSEFAIRRYLNQGLVFVGKTADALVAASVLLERDDGIELMNISIRPGYHRKGYGRQMINHLIRFANGNGTSKLLVGTGNSSVGPLAFYKSLGFQIVGTIENYFADYDPPIFEDGVRCIDLIQLEYVFEEL